MANSELEQIRKHREVVDEDMAELLHIDAEGRDLIWQAYCGKLDPNFEGDKRTAALIGEEARTKQVEHIEAVKGQIDGLVEDIETLLQNPDLQQDSDIQEEMSEIIVALQKHEAKINKLESGVVLRGVDHPFTQWAVDQGKYMHLNLGKTRGEDPRAIDQVFPGLNGRPDLVTVDNGVLTIREFKPECGDNDGREQVAGYLEGVCRYYESFFEDGLHAGFKDGIEPPDDLHGGQAILDKLKNSPASWESDGRTLRAVGIVELYHPCDNNPYWDE